MSNRWISKTHLFAFLGALGAMGFSAHLLAREIVRTTPVAEEFSGDRKPGILAEPSAQPTGPNAEIYKEIAEAHDRWVEQNASAE